MSENKTESLSSSAFVELSRKMADIDDKIVESNRQIAEALNKLTIAIKESEFNNKRIEDFVKQEVVHMVDKINNISNDQKDLKTRITKLEDKVVSMDKILYNNSENISKYNALWFKIVGGFLATGLGGAMIMYFQSTPK